MKIKFSVLSLKKLEDENVYGKIDYPHMLVSIKEEGAANAPINKNQKAWLKLNFHDTDNVKDGDKYIVFDNNLAKTILDFVEENIEEDITIITSCVAGVCRSVATAAALSKILNNEDDTIFKSGCPNMLVYRTLLEEYFLMDNFHLVWPNIWKVRESNLEPI